MHKSTEKKSNPRHIRRHNGRRSSLIVLLGLGALGAHSAALPASSARITTSSPDCRRRRRFATFRCRSRSVFSRDGHLIDEIGERRRILVTWDDLPEHVVDAFVAAEDQRFFEHPGIDYRGICAALSNSLPRATRPAVRR